MDKIIRQYEQAIRGCVLFTKSSQEEILQQFRILQARFAAFRRDDFLHRSGERLQRFGVVVYGRVKVMIDDIEGNPTIMAEVTPGHTFGESLCFLRYELPDIYICAAEDSGVIWFSTEALFSGNRLPQIAGLERSFVEMLTRRALLMNQRIQILSKLTLRDKIVTYFTFALQKASGPDILVSMSREEMALYFGTNRSALSRELSKMREEGLIEYDRKHFTVKF